MQKLPRVLAMYLPQFHRIPENDEWWGEGYTEWTAVKRSKSLYRGHYQPSVPYKGDYYDLSDASVMRRQMRLAKQYGIDGFCIYHYWFNGKKLLEKPLEALLEEKEIGLPFCICWANEAWSRRWDGSNGEKTLLVSQEYGGEAEWKEHFYYLLKFFKKEQYMKQGNKPIIVIYNPKEIENRKQMIEYWQQLSRQEGFEGIYVINVHRLPFESEIPFYGDEIADFEPFATLSDLLSSDKGKMVNIHKGNRPDNFSMRYEVINYEKFCKHMTEKFVPKCGKHNLGFFAGWDNTPRRGKDTALIFDNNTPDVFEKYFRIQYQRSIESNNNFLFINAWNEWGEGTYLEPDEKNKYGYLEAIKRTKENC